MAENPSKSVKCLKLKSIPSFLGDVGVIKVVSEFSIEHPKCHFSGKDGALDVTVTSPLAPSNVLGASREAGRSLTKAYERKMRDTAEACRVQGLLFLPIAIETLGGFHSVALGQVRQLGQALARKKGCDDREPIGQLFSRISVTLMRGNAMMLSTRSPDVVNAEVDGEE